MSEVSTDIVYAFFRLHIIVTAMLAGNALTDSAARDARDPIRLAAASRVVTISMAITASELQ